MFPIWEPFRISIHPRYQKPMIYKRISHSIIQKLRYCNTVEEAINQGWIDEVIPKIPPTKIRPRRFIIYLTDSKYYNSIPVTFSLKRNGEILYQQ